ncbi:MAG: lysophospholipid acyltransferase family protein [Chitinispirillia bacterium]|jgi:KDO2-lipid IV(A) lauroyltransferase
MGKSFFKKRRNDILYIIISFLFLLPRIIPRKAGIILFGFLGRLFFLFPTIEKKRTYKHLFNFFSNTWSHEKIKKTASNIYCNIGKNCYDAIYLTQCKQKKFNTIVKYNDNFMKVKELAEANKGAILITSHLGCFEMTIHLLARNNMKCLSIGQKLYDERVDKMVISLRQRNNITYLYRDGSGRKIIRFLLEGGMFGSLLDQDTNIEGVFADFLGIPAYTPSGPIRIAMKYSIPVFAVYSAREKDNTHIVQFSDIIPLENTGHFNRDLVQNVQKVNDIICEGILKYPEQYAWMHNRWKKKPDDKKYGNILNIRDYLQ